MFNLIDRNSQQIKDACRRPTKNTCYYHLPNVPKKLVEKDIQGLLKLPFKTLSQIEEDKKKTAMAMIRTWAELLFYIKSFHPGMEWGKSFNDGHQCGVNGVSSSVFCG